MNKKISGFTLIELIVVIAIIWIISLTIINFDFNKKTEIEKRDKFINEISSIINTEVLNYSVWKSVDVWAWMKNPEQTVISVSHTWWNTWKFLILYSSWSMYEKTIWGGDSIFWGIAKNEMSNTWVVAWGNMLWVGADVAWLKWYGIEYPFFWDIRYNINEFGFITNTWTQSFTWAININIWRRWIYFTKTTDKYFNDPGEDNPLRDLAVIYELVDAPKFYIKAWYNKSYKTIIFDKRSWILNVE